MPWYQYREDAAPAARRVAHYLDQPRTIAPAVAFRCGIPSTRLALEPTAPPDRSAKVGEETAGGYCPLCYLACADDSDQAREVSTHPVSLPEKRLVHLLNRAESELRDAAFALLSPTRRDLLASSDWGSLAYLCDQISLLCTDIAEQRIVVDGTGP